MSENLFQLTTMIEDDAMACRAAIREGRYPQALLISREIAKRAGQVLHRLTAVADLQADGMTIGLNGDGRIVGTNGHGTLTEQP